MTQDDLSNYVLNVMDKHAELGAKIIECLQYGRPVQKTTYLHFNLLTIYIDILNKYTLLDDSADESVNCLTREQMKMIVQGINRVCKTNHYLSFILI